MVVYQDFLLECDFERHFQLEVSLKLVQSKDAEGEKREKPSRVIFFLSQLNIGSMLNLLYMKPSEIVKWSIQTIEIGQKLNQYTDRYRNFYGVMSPKN